MWNLTTRLAVAIKNVSADVDWSNNTPQGSRTLLTAEDILPDATDAMILRKRALLYLQHFLVSEFDHLGKRRPFLLEMHPSSPALDFASANEQPEIYQILAEMKLMHLFTHRMYKDVILVGGDKRQATQYLVHQAVKRNW